MNFLYSSTSPLDTNPSIALVSDKLWMSHFAVLSDVQGAEGKEERITVLHTSRALHTVLHTVLPSDHQLLLLSSLISAQLAFALLDPTMILWKPLLGLLRVHLIDTHTPAMELNELTRRTAMGYLYNWSWRFI